YSAALTAEGTRVWPQMRTMREYSRMTMVRKPIQLMRASETSPCAARLPVPSRSPCWARPPCSIGLSTVASILDQAHEDLLEPVDLVAHAQHVDAERRQTREQLIEILLLRDIRFEGVLVDMAQHEAGHHRHLVERLAAVEHEGLGVQPAQQVAHAVALDDRAIVDDGDVAAEALGLFQVVRRQDDGRAAL